ADQLGASDEGAPEDAGAVAELVEQLGIAGKAHAPEHAEQLLAAVRNEDAAQHDPQHRLRILAYRAVDPAERRNVKTRRRIGHCSPPCCDSSMRRLHRLAVNVRCGSWSAFFARRLFDETLRN